MSTRVVRVGDTAAGLDEQGLEVLEFISGTVPWPDRFDLAAPAGRLTGRGSSCGRHWAAMSFSRRRCSMRQSAGAN